MSVCDVIVGCLLVLGCDCGFCCLVGAVLLCLIDVFGFGYGYYVCRVFMFSFWALDVFGD